MTRTPIHVALAGFCSDGSDQRAGAMASELRSLLGKRIRIVGLWRGSVDPEAARNGCCDDNYQMPDVADRHGYMSRFCEIHRETPLHVIVPCAVHELRVLQLAPSVLRKLGSRGAFPSAAAVDRVAPTNASQLARELSVRVPETIVIGHPSALPFAAKRLGVPFVLRSSDGEGEVIEQLENGRDTFARFWVGPKSVVVHELVQGEHFEVAAVRDAYGGACAMVTVLKTLQGRRCNTWAGVTVDVEPVKEFVERVLSGLSWHGACGVGVVCDAGGRLMLVDVQPLLPAWTFSLTRTGINLPLLLLNLSLGRALRPPRASYTGAYCVLRARELAREMDTGVSDTTSPGVPPDWSEALASRRAASEKGHRRGRALRPHVPVALSRNAESEVGGATETSRWGETY